MRVLSAFLLVPLVACGHPDVDGTWTGDCTMGFLEMTTTTVMELDLTADGDTVVGSGLLTEDLGGVPADVAVEGTLDGKAIHLELALDLGLTLTGDTGSLVGTGFDDFLDIAYEIDAKVKGDAMEGKCSLGAMGFDLDADIVLERE